MKGFGQAHEHKRGIRPTRCNESDAQGRERDGFERFERDDPRDQATVPMHSLEGCVRYTL